MSSKIVKQGYVLIYRASLTGETKVSAVCRSRADAERLQRRVGGTVAPADGYAYRVAQGSLRVLVNPEPLIKRFA
jgi:hypothetical protein